MNPAEAILIGKGRQQQFLLPSFGNRHGLVTGATGTGKTVTLQVLAEGFSRLGVPVFLADVKGDLAGLSQAATPTPRILDRVAATGVPDYAPAAWPTVFWDIFGRQGHSLRATVSDMGPTLLASLLELNETQAGVLNIAFRLADEQGLLLLDLVDLRALLRFLAENASAASAEYGNVSAASVGAIQRCLLVLDEQGAEHFFGEPALQLADFLRSDPAGRGIINILAADELIHQPKLYATFLLWLLSELWETLPEVGDPEKPVLVFFFDEAHLLFRDAQRSLLEKIEQVVRLIRSKGVGVYFVTQSPLDIPDRVLGQLGNRIQHALRAYTPLEQKALRAAAQTFRSESPADLERAFVEMGVGEALVSTLQVGGVPGFADRCLIRPPTSRIGTITAEERRQIRALSPHGGRYDQMLDRESAAEVLARRAQQSGAAGQQPAEPPAGRGANRRNKRESVGEVAVKSFLRGVLSPLGREIVRGILGAMKKR